VPPDVPLEKDTAVVASGVVELALGAALAPARPASARGWVPRPQLSSSWRFPATSPAG
jgi:uncharacterized membrane protein